MVSDEEKLVFRDVAGLRETVRKVVQRQHDAFATMTDPKAVEADVDVLWVVIMEAYARGVGSVHRALHTGAGLDREMIDQAFDSAIAQLTRR